MSRISKGKRNRRRLQRALREIVTPASTVLQRPSWWDEAHGPTLDDMPTLRAVPYERAVIGRPFGFDFISIGDK